MLTGHQGIGTSAPKTHTDPSTSKTVDTPLRRPSRAAPDAGQNLSRAAIEALAGQNITGAARAAAYLKAGCLAPPGGAMSVDDFIGVLFQISTMLGIRANKNCTDAVRAVAFVLAECDQNNKTRDISDAVVIRIDSRMDGLRKEMEEVAASVEAQAAASAELLQARFQVLAEGAAESMQKAAQGMNETTNKLTETTTHYWDAVARPAPRAEATEPRFSQLGPRLRAREGVRARQVLIDLDQSASANKFQSQSIAGIRDRANAALQLTQGMPTAEHKVKAVTKLQNGSILLELNSNEAAEWFQGDGTRTTFLTHLHAATSIKPRLYHIVVQFVPLTFRPNREVDL